MPPIYQPEPFADAVLHCCEQPIRELPVGWGAQKLMWGQKLSPRAGDLMLLRMGWKGQHTGEDKPLDSPDNLFQTLPGDPGAHGRFDARLARSTPGRRCVSGAASSVRRAAAAVVAGSVEVLAARKSALGRPPLDCAAGLCGAKAPLFREKRSIS